MDAYNEAPIKKNPHRLCGHIHHEGERCRFEGTNHPDRNTDTTKSWAESIPGAAYIAKGWRSGLSWRKSPIGSVIPKKGTFPSLIPIQVPVMGIENPAGTTTTTVPVVKMGTIVEPNEDPIRKR